MENTLYNLNLSMSIVEEVDVLVVGGGSAGTFAAISSGKQGAKTILVEKSGKLGGTLTSGGVNFPGLFHAWGNQIISGPCWDAIIRTADHDNLKLPDFSQKPQKHWHHQITVNIFTYSTMLDRMCEEANVQVLLHTMFAFAHEVDDGFYVVCVSKEGLWCVKAKVVIDATGDANVIGVLGFDRLRSESLQPATLINNIAGYNINNIDETALNHYVSKAISDGILDEKDIQGGNLYNQLKGNRISMHITDVDGSTSAGKTIAEIASRKVLGKILKFLRSYPGLENLYVSYVAEECGIRETFRIVGERNITVEEYVSGHIYDDAVCYSFYPIDLHVSNGIKQIFLNEGVVPTIPYSSLIPQNSKRVLVAGRCIAGDTDSNSAYRVQASCMAIGQVAGVAAAFAAKNNVTVKNVPYHILCHKLKEIGAIVPDVK